MAPGGRMVFLSSSSAHAPQPGRSAYSASKAGLNAFAGALAKEVERDGVAVHVVTTGPVATPMLDDVRFPMQRSEEHTSELQSLMRSSSAVFCLKTKNQNIQTEIHKTKDTCTY